MSNNKLIIRAIRTFQADDTQVFSFFVPADRLADIAEINQNQPQTVPDYFNKAQPKAQISAISEYINQAAALFPSALVLALSPDIEFKQSRGKEPEGILNTGHSGTLYLPTRASSGHIAWVVDGQKRYLALTASKKILAVPVVAFVANDLDVQREQFVVCNRANPLPEKMLDELLPKVNMRVSGYLPKRQIPAALCNLLNTDPDSPFYTLIYPAADKKHATGVISDSVMIKIINRSLKTPLGVLFQYQNLADGASDTEKMYDTLSLYWGCVREVFPDAWGKADSLLMQAPGLEAMSILMDKLMLRAELQSSPRKELIQSLRAIAPFCRWTSGTWEDLGLAWNEIKPSVSHIRALSDYLIRLDFQHNRNKKG